MQEKIIRLKAEFEKTSGKKAKFVILGETVVEALGPQFDSTRIYSNSGASTRMVAGCEAVVVAGDKIEFGW